MCRAMEVEWPHAHSRTLKHWSNLSKMPPGKRPSTLQNRRRACMSSRMLRACCLCAFALGFLLPAPRLVPAKGTSTLWAWNAKCTGALCGYQGGLADFPTVDPNYIYNQLFYMATHFQHREAGFDNNLPMNINGHDEFANYWTQEIMHDLLGFGPQIRHDSFPVLGWLNRPATVPAFNVEVSVPGI